MKRLAMAFSGPSNSGKTTLIAKLSVYFKENGLKVALIKHDPKDKACFDKAGKDSDIFYKTGSEYFGTFSFKDHAFSHDSFEKNLDEAINLLKDFDILLVEGLKTLPLPRILVFKDKIYEEYFPYAKAVASYEKVQSLDWMNLDDIENIAKYVLKNAKGV